MRPHPDETEAVGRRVVTLRDSVRQLRDASPDVTGRPRVIAIDGRDRGTPPAGGACPFAALTAPEGSTCAVARDPANGTLATAGSAPGTAAHHDPGTVARPVRATGGRRRIADEGRTGAGLWV